MFSCKNNTVLNEFTVNKNQNGAYILFLYTVLATSTIKSMADQTR